MPGKDLRYWWTAATLSLIAVISFLVSCPAFATPFPSAADKLGIMDLAGSWEVQTLDGRWESAELPASWEALGPEGGHHEVRLRRKIRIPVTWAEEDRGRIGLLVGPSVDSVCSGRVKSDVRGGVTSTDIELPSSFRGRILEFPSQALGARELTLYLTCRILLRVPGSAYPSGPFGGRALLGNCEHLERIFERARLEEQLRLTPAAILTGLLIAIGLYHLQFFRQRSQAKTHLWFGLLAMVASAFTLLTYFGGEISGGFPRHHRAIAVVAHLMLVLTVEFFWALVAQPVRTFWRAFQGANGLLALLAVLLPAIPWLARLQVFRWILCLVLFAALAAMVWRRISGKKAGVTPPMWLAGVGVPLAVVVEATARSRGFGDLWLLPLATFSALGISMVLVLSNRFSRVHGELDEMRQQLEQKAEKRTEELAQTHERLRSEVAERQLVDEALRMLERAVEQSIDGIAVVDLAGSTQFLNAAWAEMHEHDVFDVLGYELGLFHSPEQMQAEVYPLMAEVRDKGGFQGEVGHRRKSGVTFPTWSSVTLLHGESNEPVGMVFIARDISDRRQAAEEQLRLEDRARQAERLESLAILASGIAHDFNNLLTGILGSTGLALREAEAEAEGEGEDQGVIDRLGQIEAAAERAATLSDQLFSYAGEEQLTLRPLDLNELVEGVRSALEELVPAETTLQFQLKEGLAPVDMDAGQIRQVLLQLVRNGVESMEDSGGVLTIRTSSVSAWATYFEGAFPPEGLEPGPYVFFEVSDSGRGLEESTRTRMFDPFYSTKAPGRGLGLATALGIVRAHRGAIKVYSAPGRGSTFEVLFPASSREVMGSTADTRFQNWQSSGTILVVDDEVLVREVAEDILTRHGFEVLTVEDGESAMAKYHSRQGEIMGVLLDLTMPGMDGEETFHGIREIDPEARVILMSGYSQKRARQRLEGFGLAGFLHKPFRPSELVQKVREALLNPDPPQSEAPPE